MKYAYILHTYGKSTNQYAGYNIGDPIQTYALLNLYDKMGIREDNRVCIDLCDLNTYDGEYVILPMCSVGIGVQFALLPLSPKIIPVFISAHFAKTDLSSEEVDYLKRYEPIGCRDEHSMNLCRKYGILAYFSGCITAILDRRNISINGENIYLVDVPDNLESFIPKDYLSRAKKLTHLLPIDVEEMTHDDGIRYFKKSITIFEEYKEKASLVISSRMHALLPCIAMGIPVIGTFENISYRFSAFDKFIKLYSEDEFENIDWCPQTIDYESEKKNIAFVFQNVIKNAFDNYSKLYDLSAYYENRNKSLYGNRYFNKLKQVKNIESITKYIIWGCGLIGGIAFDIMSKEFPNAELVCAVDSFVEGMWNGVNIIKPDELSNFPDSFVILATFSGKNDGYKKMRELNRIEGINYVYIASRNG